MNNKNIVFIATSIDGYIADKNGGLDWLNSLPNQENIDMGFHRIMKRIDALVMGRNTFETICSFDVDWPYSKPVFVLSNTLTEIPKNLKNKATVVKGSLTKIIKKLNKKGFKQLYIDGGKTIQNFLKEDLIDELIITTIPILLGGGTKLFAEHPKELSFKHIDTKVFLKQVVQSHYKRY